MHPYRYVDDAHTYLLPELCARLGIKDNRTLKRQLSSLGVPILFEGKPYAQVSGRFYNQAAARRAAEMADQRQTLLS